MSAQILPFPLTAEASARPRAFDQVVVTHAGETTIFPSPEALRDAVFDAAGRTHANANANAVRTPSPQACVGLPTGDAGRTSPPADCTPAGGGDLRKPLIAAAIAAQVAFDLGALLVIVIAGLRELTRLGAL